MMCGRTRERRGRAPKNEADQSIAQPQPDAAAVSDEATITGGEALRQFERLMNLAEEERGPALAALAAQQPELHRQVQDLLQAGREAQDEDFLGNPAVEGVVLPGARRPQGGMRFGHYELERRIGAGGMGEVWLAHRSDGLYEGKVAIKLLYAGANQPWMRERFAREGQILGRLQHPNIARLLDAGTADDGSLYLVLEYAEGLRIDQWCDGQRLDLRQRIRLFLAVCEAVAQAHTQLVVHRDLKPSNILVTREGEVKLLDFGIAKLMEAEDGSDSELTRLAGRPLTPEYAAPEQLLNQPVTTATDVYALGVLLHLLLAGGRPYATDRSTPVQLEQAILSGAPRTLNRTFATVPTATGLSAGELAARRGSTPEKLRRLLRGDLDNIVAKALRKNPAERYGSVTALAEDLRRHLDHQPVLARGESLRYRAAKFLRRNRLGVGAAAAVLLALAGGVAGVAWQAHVAVLQAREAQVQARRAERVKDFLIGVFKAADPENSQRANMSAREVLDQGVKQMQEGLGAEPELQAELYDTLAQTYENLGAGDRALELANTALEMRRKLLPPGDPRLAGSLLTLARVLDDRSDFPKAREAIAQADAMVRSGPDRDGMLAAHIKNEYAAALAGMSRRDESVALQREAYALTLKHLGPDARETGEEQLDLAERLEESGAYDEAGRRYAEAVATLERSLGPDSLVAGQAHLNYGSLLDRIGKQADSERHHDIAIRIMVKALGPDHPMVGDALFSRGVLRNGMQRFDEGDADLRETLRIFAPGSYKSGLSLRYLGDSMIQQARFDEAEPLLRQAIVIFEKNGPDEMLTYRTQADLATAELRTGHAREAETRLRGAIANIERLTGPEAYEVRTPLKRLAEDLLALGRNEEALTVLRRVDALEKKLFGTPKGIDAGATRYLLAKALYAQGKPELQAEAAADAQDAVAGFRAAGSIRDLGRSLLLQGQISLRGGGQQAAQAQLGEAVDDLAKGKPADPAALAEARKLLAGLRLAAAKS
jgi:serine/threonine-protein kinase